MVFPLCAFRTDFMIASHVRCCFRTAIHAHFAIRTDIHAIFTPTALITSVCTVRAVFPAVYADVIRTVTAIIAVTAHTVGTVDADAAIGTEFVHASGAFAAVGTDTLRTVRTDGTALLTDLRAVAALIAVLTEDIVRAIPADIAGCTEFIITIGAFFIALGAEIGTVFASLAAGTDDAAVGAESAGNAEAVRASTVNACAAFRTKVTLGAV